MVAASTVVSAKDRLASCEYIPKLLCCTERVLDKCLFDCLDYVTAKCPHKMQNYDEIIASAVGSYQKTGPKFYNQQTTSISTAVPTTLPEPITRNVRRQPIKKPIMFVEPNSSSQKLFELPEGGPTVSEISLHQAPTYQTHGDYIYLNQRYPITEVSDSDLSSDCGGESSRPPYSPCLPRKLVDELFLTCCQQHVPSNCHSLCTYEHREHIAMETLTQAIQQDACDLKYLSNILYCANRNRDNRNCCHFLGMASPELEVGDRCLRMCNIAQSGDRIGTVKNDLVVSATGMFSCIAHVLAYVRSTKKNRNKKYIPCLSKLFQIYLIFILRNK